MITFNRTEVGGHVTVARSHMMGVKGHVKAIQRNNVIGVHTSSEGVSTDQAGLPSFSLVEICKLQETKRSVCHKDRECYNWGWAICLTFQFVI